MFAVEQLERNALVVGTVIFGEAERDFNVASVGISGILTAHLQINIVRFACVNIFLSYL